ncbi:putative P-loop containing nucleoside triphosphate hydrolase, leucine-rich repeat domain, L [Medicago truncatula]|uniref:CC-NBS-LRR resistance protein, putative n=2 Tax=Medicago truncatula TaxID=3880 RepID=G7KAZ7_MEDTR|nr:CC-NBS-LRR resistance protein, putative [Medicago truncatula]RHN54772.1 putative P-loop containing nucleoside triphosphate hydrolase, leucine-rich repeat domain, L [Medicago truncatula]
MDVAMISHSISNILQRMDTLKPLAIRLSGIDLDQLENNLKQINDKVQKKSHSEWLQKVKDVVIDLNDLTEDLRYKESIRSGLSIKNRIKGTRHVKKTTEKLKRLIEQETKLGEEEAAVISNTTEKRKSACEDFEKNTKHVAVGRENEKEELIDKLVNLKNTDAAVPVVIVIVGVPGIGKTKLAHLVCEDEQVEMNFGLQPIWIKTFDVESIAKSVAESHHEKRLLLVIDDLRFEINEPDYLEKLQKKLTEAVGGRADTAILITTRSNHVADNIAAGHVLKLQGLNQEDSWSLFEEIHGAVSSQHCTTFKIVRDCRGVPLAIVIVATAMLYNREGSILQPEPHIEKMFLQSFRYIYYEDLPTYQKLCFAYCSLFPEDYLIDAERLIQLWTAEGFLTISSNNNPEQQFGRACFNDFVPLVFHQVEEENENQYGGVVTNNNYLYRINPLMHKLARLVTIDSRENITVDSMGEGVHDGMLRVSFDYALDLLCGIPDCVFEKAKKLRTILLPYNTDNPRLPDEVQMTTSTCDKIFNTFKAMRVLDMHDLGIKTIPSSIEEVKYLRYLDLSHNNIEKLPSCITTLIHLQTLKLSQCHFLKELPKDMDDLSCLNHLDLEGCLDLTQMPSGINKLTSLQTLSLFVASKKYVTGGLRELTDLNKLRGHMEISHLEQVKFSQSKEIAKDEFLKNKKYLGFLTLRWDHEEEEEKESNVNDEKSLDCIVPPSNLRVLFIVGYNGHTLSDWFGSLHCLVKFTLNDCPKCEFLPPMDELPHLKVLQLRRLDSLKFIAKNNQVGNFPSFTTPILFFPSLKELTISDCPNLNSWWETEIWDNDRPSFSCISKLNVQYCPKLACMPLYPNLDDELVLVESNVRSMRDTMHYADSTESTENSNSQSQPFSKLKSMVIERIDQSPPKRWLKNFISLKELHIRDCFHLKSLPEGFRSLSSLETLTIERCQQLDLESSPNEWEGLINLRSLTLRSIPNLKSLPQGFEIVNSLQVLRLYDCQGLTSLPESICNFASLEKLVLSECRKLDSLPKGMETLQSLKTLIIRDCPLLLPRCQPDTGDDWPQIKHIKNIIHAKETS